MGWGWFATLIDILHGTSPPLNEYTFEGYCDRLYVEPAVLVRSEYAIIFESDASIWNCTKYPTNYTRSNKKLQPDLRIGGGSRVGIPSGVKQKLRKIDIELLTEDEAVGLALFFDQVDGIQKQFSITDNILGGVEVVTFETAKISIETVEFGIYKASISLLLV